MYAKPLRRIRLGDSGTRHRRWQARPIGREPHRNGGEQRLQATPLATLWWRRLDNLGKARQARRYKTDVDARLVTAFNACTSASGADRVPAPLLY
jgi:hypothetical protein